MSEYMDGFISDDGLSRIITVNRVTDSGVDRYGDRISPIRTPFTFKALVQTMTEGDDEVQEGRLHTGDVVIYFNPSDANINIVKQGNEIVYDADGDGEDETFQITIVIHEPHILEPTENHIEVHAKRI